MLSLLAWVLLSFLLGLLFGSFSNVLIARVPVRASIVSPGSRCPRCRHPIRWYDNIPLLSFLILRGRCRDCSAPISWRYPLVELTCALWFAAVLGHALLHVGPLPQPSSSRLLTPDWPLLLSVAALWSLGVLLLSLAVIDWQYHRLPDVLTLPGVVLGLLFTCAQAALLPSGAYDIHFDPRRGLRLSSPGSFAARGDVFLTGTEHLIYGRLVAILSSAVVLLVIRWVYRLARRREGLGLGDAKLLALVAAFLGFWPAMLALFAGTLGGAAYGSLLLTRGRAHAATALPFGSFLAASGLFSALFGPAVIAWYTSLL